MPNRFCAICGNKLDEFAPNFGMCLNCYLKENPLFELPERFSFIICQDCGRFSKKEKWYDSEQNDIFSIIEDAMKRFLLKPYIKKENLYFSISFDKESLIYSSRGLLSSLYANIKGTFLSDEKITHQVQIKINLNFDLCKNCSNIRGGIYFLSILQLRVISEEKFDFLNTIIDGINQFVEKLFEQEPHHYISKMEDTKNGVDLYLSTNELMNYIIRFLSSNYYFILKRSKRLMGRDIQRGKNLYRLKSLIKFLPINKGDIIEHNNITYSVENILKKKVLLKDGQQNKIIKDFDFFFKEKYFVIGKLGDD